MFTEAHFGHPMAIVHRFGAPLLLAVALAGAAGNKPLRSASAAADAEFNLFIRSVEVIQAATDKSNVASGPYVGIPLVAKKRTVVRVFPDVGDPTGPVAGLTAELRGLRGGAELAGSPLQPVGGALIVDPADDAFSRRRDASKSFNFQLPASWTAAGEIMLKASINVGGAIPELSPADNDVTITGVAFTAMPALKLKIVPLELKGTLPTDESLVNTTNFVRMTYPISSLSLDQQDSLTILDPAPDCSDALGAVSSAFAIDSSSDDTFVLGIMPFGLECSGMAGMPGHHAITHGVLPNRGWTAAQEIGHNFGLDHAGSDHGEASAGFEPWPYYHGGFGTVVEGRGPEGAQFIPARMLAVPATAPFPGIGNCALHGDEICRSPGPSPEHAHDFMSYGEGPAWVSPKTYQRLFDKLASRKIVAPPSGSPLDHLVVGGRLDAGGVLTLRPSYRVRRPADGAGDPGTGPFAVEQRDAAGQVLLTRRFDMAPYSTHDRPSDRHFSESMPFDARTASVAIVEGGATAGRELARIRVSPSAPTVDLTSPNGGERWLRTGRQTIRWTAGDADGDALHFAVQYSHDGGGAWHTLGINLTGTSLTVDTAGLGGATQALVRVLATDGLRTTEDRSSASFTVENHGPLTTVAAPHTGLTFPYGMIVPLEGEGSDREDGVLPDSAFVWSSSLDGAQGTGRMIDASRLSKGRHGITLTVTDSGGLTSQASVDLTVVEPAAAGKGLFVSPAKSELGVGEETVVEVRAGDIQDLYGIQFDVGFDRNLLQVVDADPAAPGVQIEPGDFIQPNLQVLRNSASNTRGVVEYAASIQGNHPGVSGSGVVARIRFRGTAEGRSPLVFNRVVLSDPQSRPIEVERTGGEITVANRDPRAVPFDIAGKVIFDRRTRHAGIRVCDGTNCVMTDDAGAFRLPGVRFEDTIKVTHPSYLRTERRLTVPPASPGGTVDLPDVKLLGGDVDQDGRIHASDAVEIAKSWNAASGDSRWLPNLDVSGDGAVNILDMVAVQFNWGATAPGPWPGALLAGADALAEVGTPGIDAESLAKAEARGADAESPVQATVVRIEPAAARVAGRGSPVRLDIRVEGAAKLFAFNVKLKFDPRVVQVHDVDPRREGVQALVGEFLDVENLIIVRNLADNVKGELELMVTQTYPAAGRNGDGVLASVLLDARAEGTTPVTIEEVELFDDSFPGAGRIAVTRQHGSITVGSARWVIYAPLCGQGWVAGG